MSLPRWARDVPRCFALKQGYGHSTPQMACEVARAAGVKRLALFHHDPAYDDESVHDLEEQAQVLFSGAFSAREGLEVELSKSRGAALTETALVLDRIAVPLLAGRG